MIGLCFIWIIGGVYILYMILFVFFLRMIMLKEKLFIFMYKFIRLVYWLLVIIFNWSVCIRVIIGWFLYIKEMVLCFMKLMWIVFFLRIFFCGCLLEDYFLLYVVNLYLWYIVVVIWKVGLFEIVINVI